MMPFKIFKGVLPKSIIEVLHATKTFGNPKNI